MKILPLILLTLTIAIQAQTKEIIGYFPEWGVEDLRYTVKNVEKTGAAEKLTTIMYAFSYPAPDSLGNIVPMFMDAFRAYLQPYTAEMSIDGVADDSLNQALRGEFNQLKKLKARHPKLKVMISIGGWTSSVYFSDAALTPSSREKFVSAVIDRYILGNLPRANGAGGPGAAAGVFDGIDLDWEYPISGGNTGIHNNPNDNNNLTELYALFRNKLDEIRPGLFLTSAVPVARHLVKNYNMKKDQQYLDWYDLMTYDLRSSWSKITGHHTNLFSTFSPTEPRGMKESLDYAIKYFRDTLGVAGSKLVPGAAFYGRGWITVDTVNCGLYRKGKVASESGYSYYSVLSQLTRQGFCYNWDNVAMAPILFNHNSRTFWSFDDEKSVALKSRYVDAYNLRGIMFWELSGDDSSGSLLKAIYNRDMSVNPSMANMKTKNIKPGLKEIKITSPEGSASLKRGNSVIITTDASKYAGQLIRVEFFVDDKPIGFDTKAPFSWVWFNMQKGSHNLRAVATDANRLRINSAVVSVNVE
ncbi:MAG: glycosyl hydrolase family 18 protein [Acidobacteriota bacterium]